MYLQLINISLTINMDG